MSSGELKHIADSTEEAANSPSGVGIYGSNTLVQPRSRSHSNSNKNERSTWAGYSQLEGSIQTDEWLTRSSQDSHSTFDREIDGQYSTSEGTSGFVRVEIDPDAVSTSYELRKCKRTVLKPYLVFLKMIGWRRLRESEQDLRRHRLHSFLNTVHPMFIFLMLTATVFIQQVTCFSRTLPAIYKSRGQSNDSHLLISCSDHIVVNQVVAGVFILFAYLYGMYLFRYEEPEHLSALMERVFLSYSQQMSGRKKRIIGVLRSYLVLGSLWILLDFILNGARMYSLQLLEWDSFNPTLLIPPGHPFNNTTVHTTDENILRYALVLFLPFGFAVYDVLYFAVVVAYASQSQLILYYITSIIEKVRSKSYSLEEAIKDIRQTYTCLNVLNNKLSTLTSFIIFLFLLGVLLSINSLAKFPEMDSFQKSPVFYMGVIVGLGNIFQWSFLTAVPLIQATRLTAHCRRLKRLGLEIASRPFVYADTPQLDLIYFIHYTNTTGYTAKLAAVPVYPWMVVGSFFLGGIICCFTIISDNHFVFARWF